MLQVVNGKFYTDETRRSNLLRGTLYCNMLPPWRLGSIETVAGKLLPSTTLQGLRTLTYEVIEEYEGSPDTGLIVSIGVEPFMKDFAAIASFGLGVTCTPDPDLFRRLVGDQPLSPSAISPPRKYIGRVFEAEVNTDEAELENFKEFVAQLIALKRSHFVAALGAIRTYVTGLHRTADDLNLAYTLLVASIESLAQDFGGTPPVWGDYADHKRSAVDKALKGAPAETIEKVRAALLKVEHVALARKFKTFALESLPSSYFREDTVGRVRPIGRADLIEAIGQAYGIRSRYVHSLEPLPRQISHPWDMGDTVSDDGRPVLTLHGLARLARQLIFAFVRSGPTTDLEVYDYKDAFPNIVRMEVAPQYWVWQHEHFTPTMARKHLVGFLDLVATMQTEHPSTPLTDIRDLLRKCEPLIPKAKKPDRLAMVALYTLFNALVRETDRVEGWTELFERESKLLDPPSLESLGVHFGLGRSVAWSAAELTVLYEAYCVQRYARNALRLPGLYEAAFAVSLAEAHRLEGAVDAAAKVLSGALDNQPTMMRLQSALDALYEDGDAPLVWQTLLLPPRPDFPEAGPH